MKRILTSAFLIFSLLAVNRLSAQSCGNSGLSACTPAGTLPSQGFQSPDSVPCISKGMAYSYADQFLMYSSFSFAGQQEVDSIQFDTITNLPCGMCWATSHANNRFSQGQFGCLQFTGTTDDSAGQYKLALTLTAWINHQAPGQVIGPMLVTKAGVTLYLRVSDSHVACVGVDTSSSFGGNLTASASCTAGINDLALDISSMSITPNPVSSSALLSFTAQRSEPFMLRITNVAGQEVLTREIKGVTGYNEVNIERGNLSAGVYLVTLSNGKASATAKLMIME